MFHRLSRFLLIASLSCGACLSACGEANPTASDDLVGGAVAPVEAATPLALLLGCTASRVGTRELLLAAHCVVGELPPGKEVKLLPGSALEGQAFDTVVDGASVENVVAHLSGRQQQVTVAETFAHPSYLAEHAEGPRHGRTVSSADIAVVRFRELLDPAIATLRINGRPPSPGEIVTLTGFGCESYAPSESKRVVLKRGSSKVISREAVVAIAAPYGGGFDDPLGAPESYWFLPGLMTGMLDDVPNAAALCKGDSGGPVIAMRAGEPTIVGVNALVRPVSETDRRGIYAAATRVDDGSGEHIATWLRGLGLPVDD